MTGLEVVAGAVGILSLAVQITESALKLRAFWSAIKGAPEEILYLIEEIETFGLVLSDFTHLYGETPDGTHPLPVQKCIGLCHRAVETLQQVITSLDTEIGTRRRIGSLKAVLKRGSVERLKERLKSAELLLMLSIQMYSCVFQKHNHDAQRKSDHLQHQVSLPNLEKSLQSVIITSKRQSLSRPIFRISSELLPSADQSSSVVGNNQQEISAMYSPMDGQVQPVRHKTSHQRRLIARIACPAWVWSFGKVLEFYSHPAYLGSTRFTMLTYSIVPWNSPIMNLTRDGDYLGVQRLLKEGKGSPFDRTPEGTTLLDIAAQNQDIELCRFLINSGVKSKNGPRSPLQWTFFAHCYGEKDVMLPAANISDVFRLLWNDTEDSAAEPPMYFRGDVLCLQFLLQQSPSYYKKMSQDDRVKAALKVCFPVFQFHFVALIRYIIGGKLNPAMCMVRNEGNATLLTLTAYHFSEYYAVFPSNYEYRIGPHSIPRETMASVRLDEPSRRHDSQLSEVIDFVKELILAGSDLHEPACRWEHPPPKSSSMRTPLLQVLFGCICSFSCMLVRYARRNEMVPPLLEHGAPPPAPVVLWLCILKSLGIDLRAYGRKERAVWRQHQLDMEVMDHHYMSPKHGRLGRISPAPKRLFRLEYGPEPEDWNIDLAHL